MNSIKMNRTLFIALIAAALPASAATRQESRNSSSITQCLTRYAQQCPRIRTIALSALPQVMRYWKNDVTLKSWSIATAAGFLLNLYGDYYCDSSRHNNQHEGPITIQRPLCATEQTLIFLATSLSTPLLFKDVRQKMLTLPYRSTLMLGMGLGMGTSWGILELCSYCAAARKKQQGGGTYCGTCNRDQNNNSDSTGAQLKDVFGNNISNGDDLQPSSIILGAGDHSFKTLQNNGIIPPSVNFDDYYNGIPKVKTQAKRDLTEVASRISGRGYTFEKMVNDNSQTLKQNGQWDNCIKIIEKLKAIKSDLYQLGGSINTSNPPRDAMNNVITKVNTQIGEAESLTARMQELIGNIGNNASIISEFSQLKRLTLIPDKFD
jgi:hypothetical protein